MKMWTEVLVHEFSGMAIVSSLPGPGSTDLAEKEWTKI